MNNEIKKALEEINILGNTILNDTTYKPTINRREALYNYITNLQQDTEMYAQLKDEYEEEIKDLQQEINKLTAESTEWESKYYEMQDNFHTANDEIERLKELSFRQHEEYEKLFNHLIIDKPRERIKKAINIYDNRNSLKYKKQRFMQGKTTADLMYEALQNGDEENE